MKTTQVKTKKSATHYATKRTRKHKAILEITLQDLVGDKKHYSIPVMVNPKLNTIRCIATKRKNKYASVELHADKNWEIVNMHPNNIHIQKLHNQNIVLVNGTEKITGKVLKAQLNTGGGTTTPPPQGLPPIDE